MNRWTLVAALVTFLATGAVAQEPSPPDDDTLRRLEALVRFSAQWSRVRVGDSGRTPHAGSHYEDEVVLRAQLDF